MRMTVNKIDNDGFYLEPVIVDSTENLPNNLIVVEIPDGFYKPKWNGNEWIEGLTQEEIDNIKSILNPPTFKDRIEALENAVLEMVLEGDL